MVALFVFALIVIEYRSVEKRGLNEQESNSTQDFDKNCPCIFAYLLS